MARFTQTRQNFSAGELGPGTVGRDDRDFYETGLKDATNILPLVSGGFTARGGFRHVQHVRRQLSAIDLSSATISGGDAGGDPPAYDGGGWINIPGGVLP
ncbi:MAG: hypothetical protein CMF75_04465 [Maricaulis sp.]|nr:hypothetical protein [Maricaulis sp.]